MARVSVSQAKSILKDLWRTIRLNVLAGSTVTDESFDHIVVLQCDEENFGTNMRNALGAGNYHGSFSLSYNTREDYLVCEVYYGQNRRSLAQLNSNKSMVEYLGFDCAVISGGTYPSILISKTINPYDLAREGEQILLAMSAMID